MPECGTGKVPDAVFVRPKQARLLQRGPARIVTLTLREMETIVARLCAATSKPEFESLRMEVFSDYVHLSHILANTFSLPAGSSVKQAVIQQSIKNVENLIEVTGTGLLGPIVVREATFSLQTLGRAYRIVDLINAKGEAQHWQKKVDIELATKFSSVAIFSQLHLECLRFTISQKTALQDGIVEDILEGARFSVMAYSYARQGLELRTVREPVLTDIILDEEDQELLEESYVDSESSINEEPDPPAR